MNAREVAKWKEQGELFVGGVTMMCPGWCVIDVSPLFAPARHRGTDLMIPGRPGAIAMPRRMDVTTVSVPMLIDCSTSHTGAPHSSVPAGLIANLEYLDNNVTGPVSSGSGTRTVSLAGRSAEAHVSLTLGEQIGMWTDPLRRAILNFSFPNGVLV